MSNQDFAPVVRRAAASFIESLESRQLLAASAVLTAGGVLRITGTDAADAVRLTQNGKGSAITVELHGRSSSFATAKMRRVQANLLGGNDQLLVGNSSRADVEMPLWLTGGAGADVLWGSSANDRLLGGTGNDRLYGGKRRDRLDGGEGNDRLSGQGGNDSLIGGAGDDRLDDTLGTNSIDGGAGVDTTNGVTEGANPGPNPKPKPEPKPQPEPEPKPNPQPGANYKVDASIRRRHDSEFAGETVYSDSGKGQTMRQDALHIPMLYELRIRNRGDKPDSFIISAPAATEGWRVEFFDSINVGFSGGLDITSDVTGGGWRTRVVQPGQTVGVRVDVKPTSHVRGGSVNDLRIEATSLNDRGKSDTVRAVTTAVVKNIPEIRRRNFDNSGVYRASIQNEGNVADSFIVKGPAGGGGWSVRYFNSEFGGADVTDQVTASAGWRTPVLQPEERIGLRVEVSRDDTTVKRSLTLTAASAANPAQSDRARITTERVSIGPSVFVIGAWSQPIYTFSKWKQRGINTLIKYEGLSGTNSLEQWISAANANGFYQIREWRSNPAADRDEPLLMAWMLPDEPDVHVERAHEDLANFRWLKEAAADIPVTGNFSGSHVLNWHPRNNMTRQQYESLGLLDARDWGMQGVYPVSGWGHPEHLDGPGRAVDRLQKWMEGKPQIAVLDSGDQNLTWTPASLRGPTPGEFRYQIWDSVVRGAKGIAYFPFRFMPSFSFDNVSPAIAEEMGEQHFMLRDLSDVLIGEIDPPNFGAEVVEKGSVKNSPIQLTWRRHGGKTYIIALNSDDRAVRDVPIRVHGESASAPVDVRFEARGLKLKGGVMTDDFAPYEVHVYVI